MRICRAPAPLFLGSFGLDSCRLGTAGGGVLMQVTELRIRKVSGEGKLRAYVTVTFDSCFVVHNIKVIEGKTGLFIAMPSRKTASGEYKDVAHPISPEFRNELQDGILAEYNAGHFEELPPGEAED